MNNNPMSVELAVSLVTECYTAILEREPDEAGLREKTGRLVDGEVKLDQIIREFLSSDEFATRLPALLFANTRTSLRFTNDVSQYGEVWMLVRHWVNAQASCGMVVDVGARGRERSNSYDLLRHFGWRGLLIEANPALRPAIERDFAGLDVRLVSCAVSDYTGRAVLTLGANDDVSSLTASLAEDWGQTRGSVEVDVRRLADVLAEHVVPEAFDILSLDIEGEDIKVLNDLVASSVYRPRWVIIEASQNFSVRTLEDAPFSRAVRALYEVRMATEANLILALRHADEEAWKARCQGVALREA